VRERTPELGVTAPGGGYDLVDGDGVMVRWAARSPAGLPLYDTEAPAAALRGDPDLADCHYNLALLYERLKRPKEAIRHMARYRELIGPRSK
jgi:hypothetical protein